MAIGTPTVIASVADQTNATVYTTSSATPKRDTLLVALGTFSRATSNTETPTVAGWSLSWSTIADFSAISGAATNRRIFAAVARATDAAPSSGTLTMTMASTHDSGDIYVVEVPGAAAIGLASPLGHIRDQGSSVYSTTGAANTNGTSISATALQSAANSNNRPMAFGFINQNTPTDISPGTNWTEIGTQLAHNNPATTAELQWRSDQFDTSVSMSWAANANQRAIIGFEIKALLGTAGVAEMVGF